jgi:putative membrane protein
MVESDHPLSTIHYKRSFMSKLLIRLIINAVALWVASQVVNQVWPGGMYVTTELPGLVIVALIFGLVNALIKPVVELLTCPINFFTLGLFTLVINAGMLLLTSRLTEYTSGGEDLAVTGFMPALLGGLVISIVSTLLSFLLADDKPRR